MKRNFSKFFSFGMGILWLLIFFGVFHVYLVSGDTLDNAESINLTEEAVKMELKVVNQDFYSKELTLELSATSLIDSGKAAVDWTIVANDLRISGAARDMITLNKGETVTVTKKFVPITEYKRSKDWDTTITVEITARAYDVNYRSVKKIEVPMNSSYEVLPLTDNYKSMKNAVLYGSILLVIVSGSIVIVISTILIKKFLNYLNTD